MDNPRSLDAKKDSQRGSYLGPDFEHHEIESYLKSNGIPYTDLADSALTERVADLIATGNVIGWFQGRMEFGPRALGNRSILGDARSPEMQEKMNLKIKFRESFRPFAPSVMEEKVSDFFQINRESPYMLLVAPVQDRIKKEMSETEKQLFGIEKLNVARSAIPAVTHVDYSARIQTVSRDVNPLFYELLRQFDQKYHCPVLINTSFNVRGEPIVCTPEDAYLCFMRTHMDYLVLGNFLINKQDQKPLGKDTDWLREFELD